MFELRLHGRGGQGVVTMAEVVASAAFDEGHEAQAFPSFGSERMGAPVMSFCRIDDVRIAIREPVSEPDAVIVCDATLLHHVDVFAGLSATGFIVLNSSRAATELGLGELADSLPAGHLLTVPATEFARRYTGRPIPTGPLLGAFAALTELLSPESIDAALHRRFSAAVAQSNARAALAAYESVLALRAVPTSPTASTTRGEAAHA